MTEKNRPDPAATIELGKAGEFEAAAEPLFKTINNLDDEEVDENNEPIPMQAVPLAKGKKTRVDELFEAPPRNDLALKDDLASMENPLFSISKKKDTKIRKYERGGEYLEVIPSSYGLATIYDKDILLYCASQLVAASREGRPISRRVRFVAKDYFKWSKRDANGKEYTKLIDALTRLKATTVKTNIKVFGGGSKTDAFGLMDNYTVVRAGEEEDARMVAVDVTLSVWFFNAVATMQVLTLHPDYFTLQGGVERRLYEICRKHTSTKEEWSIGLEKLYGKCLSGNLMRKFAYELRKDYGQARPLVDYIAWYSDVSKKMWFVQNSEKGRARLRDIQARPGECGGQAALDLAPA